MPMPPFRPAILLLAAAALLSACGGGGGGGGSAASRNGSVVNPGSGAGGRCVGTAIFGCLVATQWGLGRIRAESAWRRISQNTGRTTAPGAGQTVGVVDTGIDRGNAAFCGGTASCTKTVTEEFLAGATDETGTQRSHGTAVASVIVGRLRNAPGVAWGADVAMFAIPLGSGGGPYNPMSLTNVANNDAGYKAVIDRVLAWSSGGRTLDFVNMSFNFSGIVDMYSAADLRTSFGDTIAALAQSGVTDKTVFVWAAGNAHGRPCDQADFTGNTDLCESYVENGQTKYRVNAKSVEVLAGLPVLISELRGHVISVVAVGRNGRIASFSNRCGSAAQWCLAAPGVDIRAAYFGPDPTTGGAGSRGTAGFSGTSAAAPIVTGALVVMKHYFRNQMSNTQLVTRLLDTANDRGIYANSSIYGHGLLDLDAATRPVGSTTVALGSSVIGSGSPLAQTRFDLGSAFGNSLNLSFAGQEVAAFDALGAPFWYRLGSFASAAPRAPAIDRLNAFMAPSGAGRAPVADGWPDRRPDGLAGGLESGSKAGPSLLGGFVPAPPNRGRGSGSWSDGWHGVRLGYLDAPPDGREPGANGGHLALTNRALAFDAAGPAGLGLTLFSTEGMRNRAPVSGALLSWSPAPEPPGARTRRPLRFTGGWIAERKTMLGSHAAGAFGRLSSGSAFVGLEGAMQAGAWRLDASAELGVAYTRAGGGMLTGLSSVHSSAFAVRAERPLDAASSLRLSVSQPLRVESGRARFSIPVGRTKGGGVLRRTLNAGLAPSGRQLDLSAGWRKRLALGGELRAGATLTFHPGHDSSAPADLTLMAGWRHRF